LQRALLVRQYEIVILALLATSLLFTPQQAVAQQETTLRLGMTSFPDSFNPLNWLLTETGWVLSMVYDMGIQVQGLKNDPVPDLAESWSVSPDGLTWTFHFVRNAKWHDGTPFTSADFKFTLDYCTDYPDFNEDLQCGFYINYISTIIETETPDPYTAIVHMSEPLADFGHSWFWVLPKHVWENVPKDEALTTYQNLPPIGTGPFKYVDSKINEFVLLEANKEYFLGAPKIDKILLKYYADPDTMVQALVAGEVDAIVPPSGAVEKLKTEENIKVETWPSRSISELGFNLWDDPASTGNPALKDVKFREAIAHAINKEEIAKLAYHDLAQPAESVLTPSMAAYYWEPSAAEKVGFDLDKANQILDDLGYAWNEDHTSRIDPSTGEPFKLTCHVTNDATELISAGTLMINWFDEIGIRMELRVVDSATMIDTNLAGENDLYLWGWGWDPDPDFALSTFTTDQIQIWSDSFYSNPTYDALYLKQHTAVDPQERHDTIVEAQKLLYSDIVYVVLAYSFNIVAHRTDTFTGWVDPTTSPGWDVYWWKYPGDLQAYTPPATTSATTTGTTLPAAGPGIEMYLAALAVVIILIAVAVVVLRRRKPEKE
jgi:peptide/nickel transport system substrate-binding protein